MGPVGAQKSQADSISRRLWDWLTEPTIAAADFETRLKSRWMASILVVLLPFGLFMAIIPPLVNRIPPWEDPQVLGVFGLVIFLLVCLLLSRQGRYRAAAVVALVAATLTIFALAIIDNDPTNPVSDAAYLIATVIFSSILLSKRSTTILMVLNAIGLLLLPFVNHGTGIEGILKGPLSLLITTFALVVSGTYLRDAAEKHHMDVLQRENCERRRAEDQLRTSLAEKEVLLKEIHHRVKNNLQIISSLLSLQSPGLHDPISLAQFQDSQNRIHTMALIHECLYRYDDLARIEFGPYLHSLTGHLLASYPARQNGVTCHVAADDISLDIDTAIPCGLLVNELVSNALKHAFPNGRRGEIRIEMQCSDEGQYRLVVQDNGVGFPASVDYRKTISLGLQLVNSLTRQLGGTADLCEGPGTRFEIRFPGSKPGNEEVTP